MRINHLTPTEAYIEVETTKRLMVGDTMLKQGQKISVFRIRDNYQFAYVQGRIEHEDGQLERFNGEVSWPSLFFRTDLKVNGMNNADEILEEYWNSSIVPSITEEDVEPDGVDCYGFPSVLLALGVS